MYREFKVLLTVFMIASILCPLCSHSTIPVETSTTAPSIFLDGHIEKVTCEYGTK